MQTYTAGVHGSSPSPGENPDAATRLICIFGNAARGHRTALLIELLFFRRFLCTDIRLQIDFILGVRGMQELQKILTY